ncbi:MAG: RNA polymerase sigma factor [Clostridia bacterium]|nr:RNA polymerase sigma factor [Clostridia bacterium]
MRTMDANIIESYVEKVYGYAVNHTYSREEADDLSQEILFTVVRELPKLKDENKFEPWLWGIASNVTKSFRRHMGKQRAMYSYDIPEDIAYEEDFDNEQEVIYDLLRTKIAMLSSIYRDIIVLYYYDSLSTKRIAEQLNIPEGTVTWRLSEARKKLKKEYNEMELSALRPQKMWIDICGNGNFDGKTIPFPDVFISDQLSKNILYHCYENACGIEELAKLCGVPAYYIEDRVENLLKHEAIIEQTKGKYRTDFIIWSDKYGIYCEENAEKTLLPIMDKMLDALKGLASEAKQIPFYKAEKSEKDLFYLYGVLAFEHASNYFCRLPCPQIREKRDGFRWNYHGSIETGKHHRILINTLRCDNRGSRGHYSHTVYCRFGNLPKRDMMYDNYINACEDILLNGHSDDIDAVALAIKDGYILRKNDGNLFVNVPAFTKEQKAKFDSVADKYLKPLMDEYSSLVEKFLIGYKKLFPKHLSAESDRMCHAMFKNLYRVIIEYAQKTNMIEMPTAEYYCDVLIQFK